MQKLRSARKLLDPDQTDTALLVLAVLVGVGGGLGAVAFRWLIGTFTELLSGHSDYSAAGHEANPHVPWLGVWFVVLAPVVAGLVYGPLVHFFAREARGHGVPEVMFAVARRGGRIAPQVAGVKAVASAMCIGGGGSVGREGPIVQIGAALGSSLGRLVRVSEASTRVLVACGAAAGIAATFNAPLAGVFFAMELILHNFAARSFGMVVLSSVTASVIGRAAFGDTPFLHLPPFRVDHPVEYLLFAVLGLLAGVTGVLFTRVLYFVEDLCDRSWRWSEWLRPAVGGVVLGLLLLVLPQMYGVGYPVLSRGVAGGYGIWFVLALLGGKMLATSLTIGIGGSGGVFAPGLFMGAMLGAGYGEVLQHVAPGVAGPIGAYGLIGMGALFAGAARAPITAVIILFELTGEYTIILPLMAAIVLATGVSHLLARDSIYTAKLRRRGVDLDEAPTAAALRMTVAGEVAEPLALTVAEGVPLQTIARTMSRAGVAQVAVVGVDGRYAGTVDAAVLADTLADGSHDTESTSAVIAHVPTVRPDLTLAAALELLDRSQAVALPVVDSSTGRVTGWFTHQCVLRALSRPAGSPR